MVALNQLLIVAGPSGVGKSTFLRLFRKGELPSEIPVCLPAGSDHWPRLHLADHASWLARLAALVEEGRTAPGAVLHVDTTSLVEVPEETARVFDIVPLSRVITLAEISAPPERVARQFLERLRPVGPGARASSTSMIQTLAAALMAPHTRPGGDAEAMFQLATELEVPAQLARRLAFYRDPRWLERVETIWQQSLRRHCAGREVTIVSIDLSGAPGRGSGFRLRSVENRRFDAPAGAVESEAARRRAI